MSNSTSYILGSKQNLATPGGTAQIVFSWNTTNVVPGWYNPYATVNPVTGETVQNQADNNVRTNHIVQILPMSDVDQDGRVDLIDAGMFYYDFNSVPGFPMEPIMR